jgi:hypothetical protein
MHRGVAYDDNPAFSYGAGAALAQGAREPRSIAGLSIERGGFLQQQHTNGMLKVLNVL